MLVKPTLSIGAGRLHVGVAEAGSVEIRTSPRVSTATQSEVEGHETPRRAATLSTLRVVHVGVALPGFVEIAASPPVSTTTHSDVEGHEMPSGILPTVPGVTLQVGVADAGSVEIAAAPLESTTTHIAVATHEIACGFTSPPISLARQTGVAAVGLVEITALLLSSTATQSGVELHETSHSSGKGLVSVPVAKAAPGDTSPMPRMPATNAGTACRANEQDEGDGRRGGAAMILRAPPHPVIPS